MSTKIEILRASLEKKKAAFDQALEGHMADVRSANGQPLNDKRNGAATMRRWDQQNSRLKALDIEVQKTERAIEREESVIHSVEAVAIPGYLAPFLESGEISQWRKHPNRFFVKNGGTSRLIWQPERSAWAVKLDRDASTEERAAFRDVVNRILAIYRALPPGPGRIAGGES